MLSKKLWQRLQVTEFLLKKLRTNAKEFIKIWHWSLNSKAGSFSRKPRRCHQNIFPFSLSLSRFHNQPQFHFHCRFQYFLAHIFELPSPFGLKPQAFNAKCDERKTDDKESYFSRTTWISHRDISFISFRFVASMYEWLSMEKLFFCIIASVQLKIVSVLATRGIKVLSDEVLQYILKFGFSWNACFVESGSIETESSSK